MGRAGSAVLDVAAFIFSFSSSTVLPILFLARSLPSPSVPPPGLLPSPTIPTASATRLCLFPSLPSFPPITVPARCTLDGTRVSSLSTTDWSCPALNLPTEKRRGPDESEGLKRVLLDFENCLSNGIREKSIFNRGKGGGKKDGSDSDVEVLSAHWRRWER